MPDFGRSMLSAWMLDPTATYLNHGTVGAPPRRVLAAQQAIRDEIERQPAKFMLRELADEHGTGEKFRMRAAVDVAAAFVHVDADDLAFVENATTGANSVLRSYPLRPGDEILVTTLGYGGVTNAATYAARQTGATLRVAQLPYAGRAPGVYADAIEAALTPATRIVLVDHISAETAIVLPVADIAARCHARGALVLVDGAHVPGAIELDIASLGVDWYFGNLHKWAWTPRSSGILWTSRAQQEHLHPTVISWGYGKGLAAEFDLLGTRDPTNYLALPAALEMFEELGRASVYAYNHRLAWEGGHHLAQRWGVDLTTPEEMIGTMINVSLPPSAGSTVDDAKRMRASLWDDDRIEVPVFSHDGNLTLRMSAQIYNDMDDVDRLAVAVLKRS